MKHPNSESADPGVSNAGLSLSLSDLPECRLCL
jgi:hypothetical protein